MELSAYELTIIGWPGLLSPLDQVVEQYTLNRVARKYQPAPIWKVPPPRLVDIVAFTDRMIGEGGYINGIQ